MATTKSLNLDTKALRRLKRYILDQGQKKFFYKDFFRKDIAKKKFFMRKGSAGSEYDCGTAACVAGHCCILFDLHVSRYRYQSNVFWRAKRKLRLSLTDALFLFIINSSVANLKAAVARIDWLLKHRTCAGYDMTNEPKVCGYRAAVNRAVNQRDDYHLYPHNYGEIGLV
jgi:hypothetical protein